MVPPTVETYREHGAPGWSVTRINPTSHFPTLRRVERTTYLEAPKNDRGTRTQTDESWRRGPKGDEHCRFWGQRADRATAGWTGARRRTCGDGGDPTRRGVF